MFRRFVPVITLAIVIAFGYGVSNVAAAGKRPAGDVSANPCATNPCAANPCAANPCAVNPCATNPCATNPCATNPCATNPCATNPCATNPCATNPCATNPCATNPCATNPCATNPCATNPCATNPCATNPCATNPCGANPCSMKNIPIRNKPFVEESKLSAMSKRLWKDDSLGNSGLSCATCHPSGQGLYSEPYPKYISMADDFLTLDQMINFCMKNPMKAEYLPWNSSELTALAAYIQAHSRPKNPCATNPCATKNPCAVKSSGK